MTATDLSEETTYAATDITKALAVLEKADFIKRVKGGPRKGNTRVIWINPRYAFRGPSAKFPELLSAYEIAGAEGAGFEPINE
jgi:hypothetical protein